MLKIPTNTKELEEGFTDLKRDVRVGTEKAVGAVAKDVSNQASLTDFVKEMYAPSAKKQEGSGETAGFSDKIALKPGEMFGNIAGSPQEPGQQEQTESVLSQVSIPVDKLASTMVGLPMELGESGQSEDPLEQLLPTANQVGAWATGSATTQRVTPHMETAGQQLIPSVDDLTAMIGISSSENPGIPGQRQAPAVEQSARGQAVGAEQGQPSEASPGTMQNPAAQQVELNQAGIDPAMQMSQQERTSLTAEQKVKREQRMLHERTYFHGKQLDPIATLQERVEEERKKREQEEEQKKQEEEEEKKRREEEEERKKQELPEPGKSKAGEPNIAVSQSQKKTEVHRGAAG